MKAETKNLITDVGVIALGGVVNMVAEYVTLTYVSQAAVPVGSINVNAGDAVGIGSAVAEVVAGKVMRKPRLILFGAGGLAVSLATIVGKALISIPTATANLAPMAMAFSTARYDIAPAKKGLYR